ncbi:hypothetical protein ALX04_013475 [Lactiplantibacillus plantarum subsp. plantarum]|uniref:hypothetical protein n=1 Tax=Lactiplantibacillus pentosus TaxID=1589 RepID=UPI00062D722C|nr:hypothetical protein [Lactiplantibacillus pentosus]ASI64622.1 hypothetical protein ALX04_013475 [Lactiplantibacillus plantarum subsp. plantarum]KLD40902.1 hypothetical protein WU67_13115 [Lactiplantibacillus plantarum]AYG39351.1 hypothetical protein CFK27_16110 [Lactiplantibacillus pentosus]AYG42010.1 hypothetical protein CFI14_13265 [Lactiplantibacillus pentosus]AYJ40908.1 hypothetical protein LP314_02810 [Lactiplantibacillus pentosus]
MTTKSIHVKFPSYEDAGVLLFKHTLSTGEVITGKAQFEFDFLNPLHPQIIIRQIVKLIRISPIVFNGR